MIEIKKNLIRLNSAKRLLLFGYPVTRSLLKSDDWVIPHLHIHARASPCHLYKHLYVSVPVQMKCFHMCTNIHMFIHINVNELFSPFVPSDSCWKTTSRVSTTNSEANDVMNDEANL